jgi:addiction module HigA family antidote
MKPAHPGAFLRHWVLPEAMTVTEAAKRLGVARQALDALLNGRSSLSAEMALRIEDAFGQRMETLMQMQLDYDAYATRARAKEILKTLQKRRSARTQVVRQKISRRRRAA